MDLQAKVEARRRELAQQQKEAERAADNHVAKIAAKIEAEREGRASVDTEASPEAPAPNATLTKQRMEKLIEQEAEKLMPKEARNTMAILLFAGIVLCVVYTWHGLWLVLAAAIYYSVQQTKYKEMARKMVAEISEDTPA